jgi:hypothetical protein
MITLLLELHTLLSNIFIVFGSFSSWEYIEKRYFASILSFFSKCDCNSSSLFFLMFCFSLQMVKFYIFHRILLSDLQNTSFSSSTKLKRSPWNLLSTWDIRPHNKRVSDCHVISANKPNYYVFEICATNGSIDVAIT